MTGDEVRRLLEEVRGVRSLVDVADALEAFARAEVLTGEEVRCALERARADAWRGMLPVTLPDHDRARIALLSDEVHRALETGRARADAWCRFWGFSTFPGER